MQEMTFQRPKIQTFSGGAQPRTPSTNVLALFNNVTYFSPPQKKNHSGTTECNLFYQIHVLFRCRLSMCSTGTTQLVQCISTGSEEKCNLQSICRLAFLGREVTAVPYVDYLLLILHLCICPLIHPRLLWLVQIKMV